MKSTLLSTRGLKKAYGKRDSLFEALKGIDLDIESGESVAIVGKSGSGKSTLMHLLALLDKPSKGEITLNGRNTSKLKNLKLNRLRNKEFGFVFQSFFMNANDSVLNNVILPLKIAGIGRRERRRRALEALRVVELEDKAKNKAKDLSGGQKQRLCIARALLKKPKILVLDDSTSAVDTKTDSLIRKGFMEKLPGMTRVIVAQRILSIKDCDQIAIIDDGKIIGLGTHDDLMANSPVYKEIYDAQLGGDFDVQ
jgi:putative ABC transport system ATP-binding protein